MFILHMSVMDAAGIIAAAGVIALYVYIIFKNK